MIQLAWLVLDVPAPSRVVPCAVRLLGVRRGAHSLASVHGRASHTLTINVVTCFHKQTCNLGLSPTHSSPEALRTGGWTALVIPALRAADSPGFRDFLPSLATRKFSSKFSIAPSCARPAHKAFASLSHHTPTSPQAQSTKRCHPRSPHPTPRRPGCIRTSSRVSPSSRSRRPRRSRIPLLRG